MKMKVKPIIIIVKRLRKITLVLHIQGNHANPNKHGDNSKCDSGHSSY